RTFERYVWAEQPHAQSRGSTIAGDDRPHDDRRFWHRWGEHLPRKQRGHRERSASCRSETCGEHEPRRTPTINGILLHVDLFLLCDVHAPHGVATGEPRDKALVSGM